MNVDVEKIAKLAKIKITQQEKINLEKSIKGIIKMLEKLDKVDMGISENEKLEDVLLNDLVNMKYRNDIIKPSMNNKELINNAPKAYAGCIVVPKTVN